MGFLEKEEEKTSAVWDWVIGIALLILVAGFTFFYQYQKRSSHQRFQQADSLFQAGHFREAVRLYDELKNAQYLTTRHDSLIYSRIDSVESMEDREKDALGRMRAKLTAGDTAGAKADMRAQVFRGLLDAAVQAYLDSVKSSWSR
jgi:hypothetical protein